MVATLTCFFFHFSEKDLAKKDRGKNQLPGKDENGQMEPLKQSKHPLFATSSVTLFSLVRPRISTRAVQSVMVFYLNLVLKVLLLQRIFNFCIHMV